MVNPIKEELTCLKDLKNLEHIKISEYCKDMISEELYKKKDIEIEVGRW